MKNSSDTIGNRIRDLPACSAEPQSTAPPRTPALINKAMRAIRTLYNYHVQIANAYKQRLLRHAGPEIRSMGEVIVRKIGPNQSPVTRDQEND
jgi:hypothetical protein